MPRHGENIHKRKDGRWEGRYCTGKSLAGKRRYISVYGKSYAEAKEKMVALASGRSRPPATKASKTMEMVIDEWQKKNRFKHKESTEAKYDYMIKTHILPSMGDVNIKEITSEYLNDYAEKQLKAGRIENGGELSASYVRTLMIILSSVMKYAVEEQYCQPIRGKIYKPSIEKSQLDVMRPDMQAKFERYLFGNQCLTNFGILITLYMGLRIGEVCALSWDNVDFEGALIHVAATITRVKNSEWPESSVTRLVIGKPKTKTSDRYIPIPSVLLPLFRKFHAERQSAYVVSDNASFLNPRTYAYRYHSTLKKCGMPDVNYHALRHTFATRCIEAGVDAKTLSELLGHADVSITLNTYVHSSMHLKRRQLEKLCGVGGQ